MKKKTFLAIVWAMVLVLSGALPVKAKKKKKKLKRQQRKRNNNLNYYIKKRIWILFQIFFIV